MDIPAGLVSSGWLSVSWLLYAVLTAWALLRAPWHKLLERDSANVYFGAIVVLLAFWHLKAGVSPGQAFHFLGASAAALMFGWEFAFLAVQLLVLATLFDGRGSGETFALNVLIMGAIPTLVTHNLRRFAQRVLPHNLFIYIFLNCFFAASLGVLIAGLTAYTVLASSGAYSVAELNQNYLPFLLLLALPEGTLNGIAMTVMIVFKPAWVATFSDRMYLAKRD